MASVVLLSLYNFLLFMFSVQIEAAFGYVWEYKDLFFSSVFGQSVCSHVHNGVPMFPQVLVDDSFSYSIFGWWYIHLLWFVIFKSET